MPVAVARVGLWAELERDAHRFIVELLRSPAAMPDAEQIASRVLLARRDISATMRQELIEPLAVTIERQLELLR